MYSLAKPLLTAVKFNNDDVYRKMYSLQNNC